MGGLKAVVTDIVAFGLPGVLAFYGAEYATDMAVANVPDKAMANGVSGAAKVVGSGICYWAGAKKIEGKNTKKMAYGLGTGLLISGVTDFVDAMTPTA